MKTVIRSCITSMKKEKSNYLGLGMKMMLLKMFPM
jgi:hypothetical protein